MPISTEKPTCSKICSMSSGDKIQNTCSSTTHTLCLNKVEAIDGMVPSSASKFCSSNV